MSYKIHKMDANYINFKFNIKKSNVSIKMIK